MNTVVIEHVSLNELPAAWRAQLRVAKNTRVTVRIEAESEPMIDSHPINFVKAPRVEIYGTVFVFEDIDRNR